MNTLGLVMKCVIYIKIRMIIGNMSTDTAIFIIVLTILIYYLVQQMKLYSIKSKKATKIQ